MRRQFRFDDAELTEDQAGRDGGLDLDGDSLPGTALLQSFVGLLRHEKAEVAQVGSDRLQPAVARPDQHAARRGAMDEIVLLQTLQRSLDGSAARLEQRRERRQCQQRQRQTSCEIDFNICEHSTVSSARAAYVQTNGPFSRLLNPMTRSSIEEYQWLQQWSY